MMTGVNRAIIFVDTTCIIRLQSTRRLLVKIPRLIIVVVVLFPISLLLVLMLLLLLLLLILFPQLLLLFVLLIFIVPAVAVIVPNVDAVIIVIFQLRNHGKRTKVILRKSFRFISRCSSSSI